MDGSVTKTLRAVYAHLIENQEDKETNQLLERVYNAIQVNTKMDTLIDEMGESFERSSKLLEKSDMAEHPQNYSSGLC